ncbi:hypothetical protein GCM10027020_22000 [Nocardioides salsibiostraticola]
MRLPSVRRAATAGAIALSLTALGACGSSDPLESASTAPSSEADDPSASAEPAEPSASAAEADSDRSTAGEQVDANEFLALFRDSFEQATTATIALKTGGQFAVQGTGAIDFTQDPLAMQMSMDIPNAPGPLELILLDGVMYQGQGQPNGKFFAFDLSDPSSPFGKDFTDQLDPRASMDTFEEGLESVTFVGEKNGLRTFALVVDSAALLEGAGADAEAGAGVLPDTIEYEMSLDEDGFFRAFTADLGAETGTFEASYDNWGEPVSIKAPKESQIAQLPGA